MGVTKHTEERHPDIEIVRESLAAQAHRALDRLAAELVAHRKREGL